MKAKLTCALTALMLAICAAATVAMVACSTEQSANAGAFFGAALNIAEIVDDPEPPRDTYSHDNWCERNPDDKNCRYHTRRYP